MKIVCDNCSAKYQISDDKVRNKTFKIRCKKCSHIIVVRSGETDAAGDDSEPMVDDQRQAAAMPDEPAPQPQSSPDAVWHVVINREQVGPLTPAQVEGYFHSGDLDAESFIWAEGMADWSRLASIPQFMHLAPAPVAAAAPAGGGMFPSEDDDVIASNNVADATTRASASMFPDEDEAAGPRISTASQLRNQRNENSVLFSLDTLAAEADSRKARRSANTGGSEASGLIDITALSGLETSARGDDPFGGGLGMAPAPITAAAPVQPLVAPPSGNKTALIVAIVLGVLLLAGGVATAMYFIMKKDAPAEPVATAEPASTKVTMGTPPPAPQPAAAAVPAAAPAAEGAADDGEDKAAEAGEDEGEDSAAGDDKAEAAKAPAKRARARRSASPRRSAPAQADNEDDPPAAAARPERQVQVTKRAAPARPKKESTDEVDALLGALNEPAGGSRPASPGAAPAPAAPAGDPMLPEKLSRQQILTVVKRNARSIQACKAGTDASGTVPVEIVIGRSGRVEAATVEGTHSGTPVGSCVERKVRAFRFPQFSGEPMRIKMPFSL